MELILLRFLIGKGNDVDLAWEAFEKSMEWREKHKAHEVLDFDNPNSSKSVPYYKEINAVLPQISLAGVSKKGYPVSYQLKGRIDLHGLLKSMNPEQFSEYLAHKLIAENRYINKISREQGKLSAVVIVFCLKYVSVSHLKYLPYFKYQAEWSQLNCPELLGQAIVVNTPWFFNMIWKIVKPWLDKRTLEKVQVLGGKESEKDLQKLIDPEQIPVALGGTNPFPGLVIPDPTKGMIQKDIKSGSFFECEVEASRENQTMTWKCKPLTKDIGFELCFIDKDGNEELVIEYAKLSATGEVYSGSFLSSKPGTIKAKFDNSYSYFTGKQILYLVTEFENVDL
jgi:hypothetical protein